MISKSTEPVGTKTSLPTADNDYPRVTRRMRLATLGIITIAGDKALSPVVTTRLPALEELKLRL